MKNYKRCRALLPAMILLLLLDITITKGMLGNADNLNIMFGKGTQTVVSAFDANPADFYPALYTSSADSKAAAAQVSRQISNEGIVLLKNNHLLPLSPQQKISPLGLSYFDAYYSGTGSSAISTKKADVISPSQGLKKVFTNLNVALEQKQEEAFLANADFLANPFILATKPAAATSTNAYNLYEFGPQVYEGLESTCTNSVGIVFIKRQIGEYQDAYLSPYEDATPHMLAITAAEQALIDHSITNCTNTVVVLCSSSPMDISCLEDNKGIGAIVWMGGAGSTGYASIGDVLVGNINPSGRLPATYPADFTKDPTYVNQDDGSDSFVYSNAFTTFITSTTLEEKANTPFHEYEEGVYVGYKYYETAYDMGLLKDYYNRQNGIVYPFGYGLSYTTFSQEITNYTFDEKQVTLTVKVTNTGPTHPGQDVVQIYSSPPYTDIDEAYQIEKPSQSLIRFDKTKLLPPGEAQEITFTIPLEEVASYCYTRQNPDGTLGCYMLTTGDYTFSLRNNAHDVIASQNYHLPKTIWYDNQNPRSSEMAAQTPPDEHNSEAHPSKTPAYQGATNQFEQLNAYMTDSTLSGATILSRRDWLNTQPTAPTPQDQRASTIIVQAIANADTTKPTFDNQGLAENAITNNLVSGADNGLILADLRGKSYNHPLWSTLLDQLTYTDVEEIRHCLFEAGYATGPLKEIGKPPSVEHDGPQGLTIADVSGKNWLTNVCGYPAAPLMAATWNKQLLYTFGNMVGQEALTANINGWYAPGLNLLRSPFCGRSSEYYSEDPILSGTLGAQVVSGAGDAGLYCAIKHFPLMETEAHRSPHTCHWLTEQALRETYLKPFEIVLKTAKKTIYYIPDSASTQLAQKAMNAGDFIMTSDSALGTYWSAANYPLLTNLLRREWNFEGAVISDMHIMANDYLVDHILQAGCDLLMSSSSGNSVNAQDYSSHKGQSLLRRAVKNLCYVLVNSNLMQGVPPASAVKYSLSPWQIGLIAFNALVGLLILLGAFLCFKEVISLHKKPSKDFEK